MAIFICHVAAGANISPALIVCLHFVYLSNSPYWVPLA